MPMLNPLRNADDGSSGNPGHTTSICMTQKGCFTHITSCIHDLSTQSYHVGGTVKFKCSLSMKERELSSPSLATAVRATGKATSTAMTLLLHQLI